MAFFTTALLASGTVLVFGILPAALATIQPKDKRNNG